ncbi:HAMP domain-containing histidine kinase [Enterococcus avium]|uniref:sensor histidine kinase n=1 Tax=Enterococcus avium TaxID=33945 RepID=UPI001D07E5D9|nr:HAMP domain-containing sensor histidine kinase [Enterococcus avium]MCB6916175.1 HAMP domain-containing histidine kinase [Enterococcus avium]MCQ4960032.1 HAMP domain-containing histidine kinase [Enterococcus avium]
MKKRTIRTQLIISFLVIATLIIGSLSLITLGLTNNHFSKYVNERQEDLLKQYVNTIDLLWENSNGAWNNEEISALSAKALENNFYFSIEDTQGKIVWQLQGKELEIARSKLKRNAEKVSQKKSVELDETIEDKKKLVNDGREFGWVTFYYLGPYAYTEHDAMFISSMKQSLMYVAFSALVVSIILASWIATRLGLPLKHVSDFTHKLTRGEYAQKIPQETSIIEINSLIDSLNDLSNQLEKQDSLRKRLTTDISHELRTPLTTLKGNIEGMIDGVWKITPERLQSCYDEIDRLTRLIRNIELINKIETNYDHLKKTDVDLYKLVESVIENFTSKISEKNISVKIHGERPVVSADKDKMSQVLTNLLSNAIKFTQKEGRIDFSITSDKNNILLSIEDNGIGLEKDQQFHIFDRFYMADPSRSSSLGGQGIGLAIVKSIVEAHNGTIEVKSNLGLGTKFSIKLPSDSK